MNAFLYFIPGRPQNDQIKEIIPHLPQPFSRGENSIGVLGSGPGYLVCDDRSGSPRLDPENQHWEKSGCGRFYFGWFKSRKPSPVDLKRAESLDGDERNGWVIPKVRSWILENDTRLFVDRLPRKPRWDGEKFLPGDVVDRCRPISDLAAKAFDLLTSMHRNSDGGTLTMQDDVPLIASQILAINYHIGPDEFAALPAFDYSFDHLVGVLMDFTGFGDLMELDSAEKKTSSISN